MSYLKKSSVWTVLVLHLIKAALYGCDYNQTIYNNMIDDSFIWSRNNRKINTCSVKDQTNFMFQTPFLSIIYKIIFNEYIVDL